MEKIPSSQPTPLSQVNKSIKPLISLILGILSLILWIIPLPGLTISIAGLVLGIKGRNTARKTVARVGIILCVVGITLSLINWGANAFLIQNPQVLSNLLQKNKNSPTPPPTIVPEPGKRYEFRNLGISFIPPIKYCDSYIGKILYRETELTTVENRVYLYNKYKKEGDRRNSEKICLILGVFEKKGKSMEAVIKSEILTGYPKYCEYHVSGNLRADNNSKVGKMGIIRLADSKLNEVKNSSKYYEDQLKEFEKIENTCPQPYVDKVRTGAPPIYEFFELDSVPDKFFFIELHSLDRVIDEKGNSLLWYETIKNLIPNSTKGLTPESPSLAFTPLKEWKNEIRFHTQKNKDEEDSFMAGLNFETYIFTKNDYKLTISYPSGMTGRALCSAYESGQYKTLNNRTIGDIVVREIPGKESVPGQLSVCGTINDKNRPESGTKLATITYYLPKNWHETTLNEMDIIVESLRLNK